MVHKIDSSFVIQNRETSNYQYNTTSHDPKLEFEIQNAFDQSPYWTELCKRFLYVAHPAAQLACHQTLDGI